MTAVITVEDRPDDGTVAAIRALLARAERDGGDVALDDQKRSQVGAAGGWSAVLARRDGRLLAYAHIRWGRPGARPRAAVELAVDPEARGEAACSGGRSGLARRLTEAARDAVAAGGGGWVHVWQRDVDDPAATVPARLGMEVQRRLARMEVGLDHAPRPPALPPGVRVRPYRPGRDDAALLAVNNAAFAGHPEQGGWTAGDLAARRDLQWFDPADVLCAWRGDALDGFHWMRRHGGEPPAGEVYVLAIHPRAQSSGLGRVLLLTGLARLHARGARTALLYVDLAEEAAVGLYESAGFTVTRLDVCYEQRLEAA